MVTTEDFLRFWAKAIPSLQIHPDDAVALKANRHALALDALVGPFMGPVRTAPVVLLTLNGGINGVERDEAKIPATRELMARNLGGDAPLPTFANNPGGREWTERRLAQFGLSYKVASLKVAFVNLIPYRSREGAKDLHMLECLESARLVRAWAHDTLFREAEVGTRVVVCLRSARRWGLEPDTLSGACRFLRPNSIAPASCCTVPRAKRSASPSGARLASLIYEKNGSIGESERKPISRTYGTLTRTF